jgi:hypothetical protein
MTGRNHCLPRGPGTRHSRADIGNTLIFEKNICCIHVVAYFSLCDEVLLYFIVE